MSLFSKKNCSKCGAMLLDVMALNCPFCNEPDLHLLHVKSLNETIESLRTQLADAIRMLEEARKDAERLLPALRAARDRVQIDRDTLFECHRNPLTNTVDDDLGIQGLEEYDDVLNQIDQAIEQGKGVDDDDF